MSEAKIKWLKDNAPAGVSHYRETKVDVIFISPNNPEKTVRIKKPEWMI